VRIIAGEFRGRKLLPPADQSTRPITDRAKQSLFDILTPHLDGAHVYDLFAGTGSMGLESLSRGVAHATFFESNLSALRLLDQNIAALKVQPRTTVIRSNLFHWFSAAKSTEKKADLIFLDPPYRYLTECPDDLLKLAETLIPHLIPQSLIIFRHDEKDTLNFPGFTPIDIRTYGSMQIEIIKPEKLTTD
jgi:16S rRNA (guanine966-N2)-methyltransferase